MIGYACPHCKFVWNSPGLATTCPQCRKPLRTVELRSAFVWDCPVCQLPTYCRAVVREFDEETSREKKAAMGVGEFVEGVFITAPESVTCAHCSLVFLTSPPEPPHE